MNSTTHSNRQEYGAKKLAILRKGKDYLNEKAVFSEQKPSKNTQSLHSKASRNAY